MQFSPAHNLAANKDRGFTLVETLVAIAILMIAIAGPLVVASKGLTSSLTARDQMIAAYLVQESMEYIKNTRDNNMIYDTDQDNYPGWLNHLSGCVVDNPCDASAIYDANTFGDYDGIVQGASNRTSDGYMLFSTSNGYTSGDSGFGPSIFRRKFFITPVSDSEVQVTVIVNWSTGVFANQISLSSELTKGLR